jgi:hypothetical protein
MGFKILAKLFLIAAICAACASTEEFQAKNCNREVGYERGVNDAQEKKPMDSSFAASCPEEMRKEAMLGYREGYEKLRAQAGETGVKADETGVRVKVPGVDINIPNKASRAWVCELETEGEMFTAFGATRREAARSTRSQCRQKLQAALCGPIQCEENK